MFDTGDQLCWGAFQRASQPKHYCDRWLVDTPLDQANVVPLDVSLMR